MIWSTPMRLSTWATWSQPSRLARELIVVNSSYNADADGFKEKFINTVYSTDYVDLYRVTLQNLMKQVVPRVVTEINNES
jgi:hypothetical protein